MSDHIEIAGTTGPLPPCSCDSGWWYTCNYTDTISYAAF